jgi:hypothetical protein
MCSVHDLLCLYRFMFLKIRGLGVGAGVPSGLIGAPDREVAKEKKVPS